jgi:pimeloyl-ACP methyl ester carboxylesterase
LDRDGTLVLWYHNHHPAPRGRAIDHGQANHHRRSHHGNAHDHAGDHDQHRGHQHPALDRADDHSGTDHDHRRPDPGTPPSSGKGPYGRLEVFERSGHYPFVEEPEPFTAVVAAFLSSVPG